MFTRYFSYVLGLFGGLGQKKSQIREEEEEAWVLSVKEVHVIDGAHVINVERHVVICKAKRKKSVILSSCTFNTLMIRHTC